MLLYNCQKERDKSFGEYLENYKIVSQLKKVLDKP